MSHSILLHDKIWLTRVRRNEWENFTPDMEETYCAYCLARDIAMPYSPSSLLQAEAVAEMAAVSSATP